METHCAETQSAESDAVFLPEVLRIGIPEIDAQHEALFRQVNQIENACIDRNLLKQEDADALLESLRQHFVTEAHFAEQAGLDFGVHDKRHEEMYRTVALALEQGIQRMGSVFGMSRYLQYWFERHIVQDDLPIGRAFSAMNPAIVAK